MSIIQGNHKISKNMNKNNQITSPVLFLCFNRPDKTQRVFECIRRSRPAKLYVAADAPREGRADDFVSCQQVREIVQKVDWPCETHYLFHEKNLGCTLAGKTAWDWIFSQEEDMIFLEDDGLVSDSFFPYCQELLNKYRNDSRIAYIGAVNFGPKYGDASYFFTKISVSTYAMATWKRAYDLYEYDLESYEETRNTEDFLSNFDSKLEKDVYLRFFDKYVNQLKGGFRQNTYDLQMVYFTLKHHLLSIYPNVNLVTNIGFDYDGSNTVVDPNSEEAKAHVREKYEIADLIHPATVGFDKEFEQKMFQNRFLNDQPLWKASLRHYVIDAKILVPVKKMVKTLLHR